MGANIKDSGRAKRALIRLRIGSHDAHYAGDLVDGAKVLQFFGDVATELLIRLDGDEGLFRAYENIEFLAPVRSGDYLEVEGKIVHVGKTSRKMEFEARKVIELEKNVSTNGAVQKSSTQSPAMAPSAARIIDPPLVVCRAVGTCVTPLELQRKKS